MKKKSCYFILLGVVLGILAVASTITTIAILKLKKKKKKEDEELEYYLDYSIQ